MPANRAKLWSKIKQEKGKWRLTLVAQQCSNFWTKLVNLQPLQISPKVLEWMVEVVGYELVCK